MSLEFLRNYAAERMADYAPQPTLFSAPGDEKDEPVQADLDYELAADQWIAQPITVPLGWRVRDWQERPIRFVDGKDVGQTVAWLRAPGGYPVPVRLAEIGATCVRVEDGICRREFCLVERVVSMIVDLFPWDEVESFAAALQEHGFRLLPAERPQRGLSYDFEEMRQPAEFRSTNEMIVLEEAALAQSYLEPTIVDGPLEPRTGGLDQFHSPVAGVVKSHARNYLHAEGMQLLYDLLPGERTPLFALPNAKLPVISWYVKLSNKGGKMPNWGYVRVELPLRWFEHLSASDGITYVNRLSHLLCEYRSHNASYPRAPVSVHPIIRAEQLLGALFTPTAMLVQRFYRLTQL